MASLAVLESLHLSGEKLLAIGWPVATAVFDSLLEVLALLRHNYQGSLVLTERTNLL